MIAIKLPLLCDYCEHYFAPFLHKWAWWTFILQAFGTDFLIVPPTSIGFEMYQFAISSAIKLRFKHPSPLTRPFPTEYANYESSVGCPGSKECLPPPHIVKDLLIFSFVISLSNYKYAPITSPNVEPHNAPLA